MTPRRLAGAGLLLSGALLLAWSLSDDDGPAPSAVPPRDLPSLRVGEPRAAAPSRMEPAAPEVVDSAAPPSLPDTPLASAQAAAFPGWFPVRCPRPGWLDPSSADGPSPADLRFLPPHRGAPALGGLGVDGDDLVAAAAHPQGEGLLQHDLQVVSRISWGGPPDADGERACTLAPPVEVSVSGVVTGPDGQPVPGLLVRVCDPANLVETDPSGAFDALVAGSRDCRLLAVQAGPGSYGVGPVVVITLGEEPVAELVLQAPDPAALRSREDLLSWLDQQAGLAEDAQAAAALAPTGLELALGSADLPADARPLVQAWADAEAARRTAALDRLEQAVDAADPASDLPAWLSLY